MSALVDEIRAKRGNPDDPFDQGAARSEFAKGAKRRGKATAEKSNAAYQAGRREERTRAKTTRPKAAARPAPKKRRASRPMKRATRQIVAPLEKQYTSGLKVLGLTLGVVALYLVLENAGAASGALNGFARGLEWLRAPDRSIPYGPR